MRGRATAQAVACAVLVGSYVAARAAAPPDPDAMPSGAEGVALGSASSDSASGDAATVDPGKTSELRERVAARDREIASLRGELERLKAKAAVDAVPSTAPPAVATAPTEPLSVAPVTPAPAPLLPPPRDRRLPPTWQVETATALAALIIGFAIGWRTLDRRIRRKYGGLKIY